MVICCSWTVFAEIKDMLSNLMAFPVSSFMFSQYSKSCANRLVVLTAMYVAALVLVP